MFLVLSNRSLSRLATEVGKMWKMSEGKEGIDDAQREVLTVWKFDTKVPSALLLPLTGGRRCLYVSKWTIWLPPLPSSGTWIEPPHAQEDPHVRLPCSAKGQRGSKCPEPCLAGKGVLHCRPEMMLHSVGCKKDKSLQGWIPNLA